MKMFGAIHYRNLSLTFIQ